MNGNDDRIAGILTRGAAERRNPDAGRSHFTAHFVAHFVVRVLLALLSLSSAGAALANPPANPLANNDSGIGNDAGSMQPVSDITQAAEDFLRERIRGTERRITPRAGELDPRLRLPRCDTALLAYLRPGSKIDSRTIVGVRCSGSSPWKVYVPVDVLEMRTVLVARRSLPRNHQVVAGDLVAEERDVSRIMGGYVTALEDVVGKRLERRLASGNVISPSMLQRQIVIQRGQSVTLVVRNDALNIRMAGTALMDGALNQRIRVENTASERIVEGLVRSPQFVEVLVR